MTTVIKPTKDAKFFTNMSNARRALKKIFNCSTEVANSLINLEALEDGGRYWFSEAAVNRAANPSIAADKIATVAVPAPAAPEAPKASKVRSEIRNGVRRPIKGKCAEVWSTLDDIKKQGFEIDIHVVRELAAQKGWNLNNATIEFYGWRKFHAVAK
ncbi:hypothetical protein PFOEGONH_00043 [Klebsiella phage vB_KppS-Pokey]|nr:hypothetical protein LCALLHIG_00086 [Klebsiella phage vB_KppS-Raw]CAD5235840.1 hypothetical protein PFOEGONH_00043 [Klebsiella phage vB_KppS-Pokey]CAD5235893.1 hypothetical protein OPBIHMGG_00031 [Klebsiella phage vB_KppS-Eggy]